MESLKQIKTKQLSAYLNMSLKYSFRIDEELNNLSFVLLRARKRAEMIYFRAKDLPKDLISKGWPAKRILFIHFITLSVYYKSHYVLTIDLYKYI